MHLKQVDGGSVTNYECDEEIILDGKIDGHSSVRLASSSGSVIVRGKIDGKIFIFLNSNFKEI